MERFFFAYLEFLIFRIMNCHHSRRESTSQIPHTLSLSLSLSGVSHFSGHSSNARYFYGPWSSQITDQIFLTD